MSSSGITPGSAIPSNFLDLPPETVPNAGWRSPQQIRDFLPFVIGRPENEDLRISAAQPAEDDFQIEAGIRLRNLTLFRDTCPKLCGGTSKLQTSRF